MQFQELLARTNTPEHFDCSRSGHEKDFNCLFCGGFEIDVDKVGKYKIESIEDIENYMEDAQEAYPNMLEIDHLKILANICSRPIITQMSIELYRMHNATRNGLYPYPGGYFNQLSIFVQAQGIISSEENRIMKKAKRENE